MAEGSRQHFCESCGTEIRPTANFCTNCGAAQKPDQQVAGQPETLPQDGMVGGTRYFYRKTPAIISTRWLATTVVVILLLGGGVSWALISGHTPWQEASQPTPPPSEQTATQESATPSEQTTTQESSTSSEQAATQGSSTPSEQPATQEAATPSEQSATQEESATPSEQTATSNSNKGVVAPTGYVLEDCQQGVGATGKTIYYRAPLPPQEGGRMHTYWFECVHGKGDSPIVNVVSSPSTGGKPQILGSGGPYCAFSTVDMNIGCALEPITEEDLMNPPTGEQSAALASSPPGRTAPFPDGSCPSNFPIKGNAQSNLYHLTSSKSYNKTKAEDCFATERDARNAGYIKAQD
jgi:DNA mismatch repair ATPase MutL